MRLYLLISLWGAFSLPIYSLTPLLFSKESTLKSRHSKRGFGGWSSVQYPTGSIKSSIPIRNGELELFAMTKESINKSKLKRIVFVIHGMGRDPWNYYSHMTTALQKAHGASLIGNVDEVGIWAPGFWNDQDEGIWPKSEMQTRALSNKQLVWHRNSWTVGGESIYPSSEKTVSSFTAIDDAIRYFGDKTIFPRVEIIVLAGHSAGGQMLQRYAQLGNQPFVSAEVHYYIANPASYMYLDDRRPEKGVGGAKSRATCDDYNDYKYGLNKVDSKLSYNSPHPSKSIIFEIYKERNVHYQLGTADHASSTKSCGALVQGDSHFNRGRIYQAYLEMMGYPAHHHTIDYIEGVRHDDLEMFKSQHGMYRLFVENQAQGKTIPSSKDRTHGLDVTFTAEFSNAEKDMPGL